MHKNKNNVHVRIAFRDDRTSGRLAFLLLMGGGTESHFVMKVYVLRVSSY